MNFKPLKKDAHRNLHHHYFLFVILCLIVLVFGREFNNTRQNLMLDTFREVKLNEEGRSDNSALAQSETHLGRIVADLRNGDLSKAEQSANESMQSYQDEKDTVSNRFGRTQGVLAHAVNLLESGTLIVRIFQTVLSVTHSDSLTAVIMVIAAQIMYFAVWIFIKNVLSIILRRMLLEGRTYDNVPMQHVFHFHAVHRWKKVSLAYLRYIICQTLWDMTVIGGIIKHYSYYCVSFILAENPDLTGREAVLLSRKMMNGHKWEAFKLDLTMIGWDILTIISGGIAGVLYVNPYKVCVSAEYYAALRQDYMLYERDMYESFNDTYLFKQADQELLDHTYEDVLEDEAYIKEHEVILSGCQKFFAENFSVWAGTTKKKRQYQKIENMKFQIERDHEAAMQKQYPSRLNPLYIPDNRQFGGSLNFLRCYTFWCLCTLFFLFSFIGWLWEVSLFLVNSGTFVNRGVLLGPWLPIYGTGGVLAIILLTKVRKKPVLTFFCAMVVSGIVEYYTSYFLQMKYNQRWWDYTGYFMNLDGRICLEGLFVFGVGCMMIIYFVAPMTDRWISKVKEKQVSSVAMVLLLLFGTDAVYSHFHPNEGAGVTNNNVQKGEKS